MGKKHLKITDSAEGAKKITELISSASFFLFRDKKFRQLTKFETFDQTEQDRMFNEIVVSGIAMSILMFETVAELTSGDWRQFYYELKTEMESYYGNWLRELGVEEELASLWKSLIQMRVDQYKRDYEENKDQIPGPVASNPWGLVVAIGGSNHIMRGEGPDEFYKMFLSWMANLSTKITNSLVR